MTHGGIDGYSRLITFLKCSSNNRATTVYERFLSSVQKHQLPSHVAQHMIERRGAERRSVITGSSVHNQRIRKTLEGHAQECNCPVSQTVILHLHWTFLKQWMIPME